MLRYRKVSFAKRIVIASTFLTLPAIAAGDEPAALTEVVESQLKLLEPTSGEPLAAASKASEPGETADAPRVSALPGEAVGDGWVARRRDLPPAPLRDPVSVARPPAKTRGLSPAPDRRDRAPGDGSTSEEARREASEDASTGLDGLIPVPRMQAVPDDPATALKTRPRQNGDSIDRDEASANTPRRVIPLRRPDLMRAVEQPEAEPAEDDSPPADGRSSDAPEEDRTARLREYFRPSSADRDTGDANSQPLLEAPGQSTDRSDRSLDDEQDQRYVGDLEPSEATESPRTRSIGDEIEPERPEVTAAVRRLQGPLEAVLRYYYQQPENAQQRSSWGMLHSIMVYGVETQVLNGRKRYNAVAWMAGNNICRGKRIFSVDRAGIAPRSGVGLQGHQGQFLAVFGLIGVPESYPLYVGKQRFSVADLVAREQADCRPGVELTFTLIGLSHYLDTDASWTSSDGQHWDFERLIQEELSQQVIGAACGGTHRLMGLSHALKIRRQQGLPITGQWARADQFIKDFVDYAWKLQNPDGSMSTEWFESRGNRNDVDRKIQTTGHIVEWLIGVLPPDQLQDPRMVRAIGFLANTMARHRGKEWEIGPKGHALRSLALYHERVISETPPWRAMALADRQSGGHSR